MHILKSKKEQLTSRYGPRVINGKEQFHYGQDYVKRINQTDYIIAAQKGKVVSVGFNVYRGYFVELEHYGDVSTFYQHMKKGSVKVKKGQIVKLGQVIGYMGSTGDSTGSHLHFEVRVKSVPHNPEPYMDDDIIILPYGYKKPSIVKVGDTVKITGKYYATGEKIPLSVKLRKHKVIQVEKKKVLLAKILSWVAKKDVKKV